MVAFFFPGLICSFLPTPSPQQSSTETSQWSSDSCPVILLTMNSRKHKLWLFLELHLSVPKRLNKDSFYQTRAIITILILLLLELVPIQGILPESVFLLFSSTGFTPKSSFFCFVNAKVVVLHEGKLSPWEYGLFREERS